METNVAKIYLLKMRSICEKFGVPLILAKGVLIGAIRDNALLPGDKDIDLFTLYTAPYEKIVQAVKEFIENGFKYLEIYKIPSGKIIHWSFDTKANLHFCFKILSPSIDPNFLCETGIVNGRQTEPTITLLPTHLFVLPKEIIFLGHKFLVPNPPEDYLTNNYGNWRVPYSQNQNWRKSRTWQIYPVSKCPKSPWKSISRVDMHKSEN